MLSTEIFFSDGLWRYAIVERGQCGQIIERSPSQACTCLDVARKRAAEALKIERNKRNA